MTLASAWQIFCLHHWCFLFGIYPCLTFFFPASPITFLKVRLCNLSKVWAGVRSDTQTLVMFIKILKNSYPVNDFELKFHTLILVISLKHIISRASLRSTLENPKSFYPVYDQKIGEKYTLSWPLSRLIQWQLL